jgi:hypothetical protein
VSPQVAPGSERRGARRRAAGVVLAALCALAGGCAPTSTTSEALGEARLERVAVAPFAMDAAGRVEPDASALVRARVVEALAALEGLELVPPEESDRVLEQAGLGGRGRAALGKELARAFGVDGVLHGRVRRYSSRVGGPRGAEQPAAVWFELELRSPDGTPLWRGAFQEEQQSLSENLLSLPRAIERGFQWVEAEELVQEGVQRLIGELDRERQKWK